LKIGLVANSTSNIRLSITSTSVSAGTDVYPHMPILRSHSAITGSRAKG